MSESKVYKPYLGNLLYSLFTFACVFSIDFAMFYEKRFIPAILVSIVVLSVFFRMVVPNLTIRLVLKEYNLEYRCNTRSVSFSFNDIQQIIWDQTRGLRKSSMEIRFKGGGIRFNPNSIKNMEECIKIIQEKSGIKVEVIERILNGN